MILVGLTLSPDSETGASKMGANLFFFLFFLFVGMHSLEGGQGLPRWVPILHIFFFFFLSWSVGALSPESETGA